MKKWLCFSIIAVAFAPAVFAQAVSDPARIDVYVTPYYNSKGPAIDIGQFSKGLSAGNESEFVATIAKMKQSWNNLRFPEIYVAAIRLYDLGFRNEATYWFYSAQYRSRLFRSWSIRKKWGAWARPHSNWCRQGTLFSN
jgi:hypothetical protein